MIQGMMPMPNMDINYSSAVCRMCGTEYSRLKGYFPISHGQLYKGVGYVPYCRDCIDVMYAGYLKACGDERMAVRQMCRKLDLYWNDSIFNEVDKQSTTRTMMTKYMAKLNATRYAGMSYDDSLKREGALWKFAVMAGQRMPDESAEPEDESESPSAPEETPEIDQEILDFWGPGYSAEMYQSLEDRRQYWLQRLKGYDIDAGAEALIRQACGLELDINRERAAGRSTEKLVGMLNTVLGGLQLKPGQKKSEGDAAMDNTPFGVWIKRWEDQRPIPEPDPKLKDVDGIIRYIEIWFKGHLSKMLNLKNSYSKMYEEEMARRRVEHPEYDGDDEEQLFNDIFAESGDDS